MKVLSRWTLAINTITLSSTVQLWPAPPGFADADTRVNPSVLDAIGCHGHDTKQMLVQHLFGENSINSVGGCYLR